MRLKSIKDGHEILEVLKIPVESLSDIFEEYAGGREVDFMSIDVEGFDKYESNNFWSERAGWQVFSF